MSARPTVSVYAASEDKVVGSSSLPAVFSAPIRHDIVVTADKVLPWLPEGCMFPLYKTTALEAIGQLAFDKKDTATDGGCYGEVFPGTYTDDTGVVHRMCAKRDGFLTTVDMLAADGDSLLEDAEIRPFYARVSNDLTAAWRLLGDPHVVNYLAITTTTRQVASGIVVLPEYFIMEEAATAAARRFGSARSARRQASSAGRAAPRARSATPTGIRTNRAKPLAATSACLSQRRR
jgi:hypothetical protein